MATRSLRDSVVRFSAPIDAGERSGVVVEGGEPPAKKRTDPISHLHTWGTLKKSYPKKSYPKNTAGTTRKLGAARAPIGQDRTELGPEYAKLSPP